MYHLAKTATKVLLFSQIRKKNEKKVKNICIFTKIVVILHDFYSSKPFGDPDERQQSAFGGESGGTSCSSIKRSGMDYRTLVAEREGLLGFDSR